MHFNMTSSDVSIVIAIQTLQKCNDFVLQFKDSDHLAWIIYHIPTRLNKKSQKNSKISKKTGQAQA